MLNRNGINGFSDDIKILYGFALIAVKQTSSSHLISKKNNESQKKSEKIYTRLIMTQLHCFNLLAVRGLTSREKMKEIKTFLRGSRSRPDV